MHNEPYIPLSTGSFPGDFTGDYRFSFQSQEIDPEYLSGAVSFKYRVHDSRIGRFLSVDPLAPDYSWNSVYAFSENSPIAFIELEGLERFYAADGTFLGVLNDDPSVKILNDVDLWYKLKKIIEWDNGSGQFAEMHELILEQIIKSGQPINGMKLSSGPILNSIFNEVAGDVNDLPHGRILVLIEPPVLNNEGFLEQFAINGNLNKEQRMGAAAVFADAMTFSDGTIAMKYGLEYDNYYDLASVLYHESLHSFYPEKYTGDAFGEFDAHFDTMSQSWYVNTSGKLKNGDMESLKKYLDLQREYISNNSSTDNAYQRKFEENLIKYESMKTAYGE